MQINNFIMRYKLDPDEIKAMEPGDELDKLVADEFMDGILRKYSTEISDAWTIVEKLVSMDWRVDILYSRDEIKLNGIKLVGGKPYSVYAKYGSLYASTVPEGICKLALLVKIIEEEVW